MSDEAVDAQRKFNMFAHHGRRGPRGPGPNRKKTNMGHDQYAPASVGIAPESPKPEMVERSCLKCDKSFMSEGPHNRLCRNSGCVGSR
ncbi:hypothetical protein LCGC14_2776230 [marine sediment metagenome]|uniref:Uncharacterized protein n=1 Tax=marine sediment metagenome TaxID=412755 RepID=A0A0F9BL73_9ZZZZ